MRVLIEQYVTQNVSDESITPLVAAIEGEDFSDACCIGGIAGTSIYLRCPGAPHGVVADGASLDDDKIRRIIQMLKASVEYVA